jgi:hypothetical protein
MEAPPTAIIPFHCRTTHIIPLHNDTHGDELADLLLLFEQFIGM